MINDDSEPKEFFEYRGYLAFLAKLLLKNSYNGKVDHSDIVQQTLLNAYSARSQCQGKSEAGKMAWLREILGHVISHATREMHTKKRDIHRELSIAADLDASSMRLERFLTDKEPSPSQALVRKDRIRIVAAAIEILPDEQRQVINYNSMIRDYRILECIGQGGMGSVYRALDVRLNRYVAVKILKSERMGTPEAISRFSREMRLLAQLDHKHIVQVFEGGEQNGVPYFVMELVNGVNLSQLVRRLGPLPVPEACSIVQLAASALQYAHDQKVIHRDIKPSNLMITAKGDVQLLDLGLAQILEMEGEDAVSRADQVLGTLAYMSPEQRAGRQLVTSQSDIFSLGITLYELLTGQRPSETPGMLPLVSDIRSLRPDVDKVLNALVHDMIALDPAERPRSMADVESRLSEISTTKNLSDLVAEYYRWDNRTLPRSTSDFAKVNTGAKKARRADSKLSARTSPSSKWISGLAFAGAVRK